MSSNQFELKPPPTDAISALTFAPSLSPKLLVSSWDRYVYLYDTHAGPDGQLLRKYEHRAPVLDVCFGNDDTVAYSGGLDWDVRRIDLENGHQTILSSHTAGIKSLVYSAAHKLLISASWDNTLHIHNLSTPTTTSNPCTLPLPAKPFALALSPTKLIVAMSARLVHIHDLAALSMISSTSAQPPPNEITPDPFQVRESSLKFMTRALACMPNDAGYASSSIEGRVAVEWFDASAESQARKYAFKCHRQPLEATSAAGLGADEPIDIVYPVHALAFHPHHGTFVSGGGDGVVALWDAVAKRRIRQYQRYATSVAAMSFSSDGKFLAVGVCPGFEDGGGGGGGAEGDVDCENGSGHENGNGSGGGGGGGGGSAGQTIQVFVRELAENETKGKGK